MGFINPDLEESLKCFLFPEKQRVNHWNSYSILQLKNITATALKPQMNNTDYLVTKAPVKQWEIIGSKAGLEVEVLEAGNIEKTKDLSDFDKGLNFDVLC